MVSPPNKLEFLASACLAGIKCTYNARSNLVPAIRKSFLEGRCLLVCPEVMGGLTIPREPLEMTSDARIVDRRGRDLTRECLNGTAKALRLAKKYRIKKAILKTKSPCCGVGRIYDGTFRKVLVKGNGMLAGALIRRGIKVTTEKT